MGRDRSRDDVRRRHAQNLIDDLRARRDVFEAELAVAGTVGQEVVVVDFHARRRLHGLAAAAALARTGFDRDDAG